ncbi:DUF2309 domain-containing protein [Roseiconus lacunae]|uniref:DUF2309 domain-containing protein n=1 Tax=Roseiconus lacunae TaxID=2605694 RepID=UPI001E483174|nr:DUF2309 domain-containing protein [Roseiconus lacunae]MCD0462561.1 DUF2309 domain-containing protein [Roseiconus lacunae]
MPAFVPPEDHDDQDARQPAAGKRSVRATIKRMKKAESQVPTSRVARLVSRSDQVERLKASTDRQVQFDRIARYLPSQGPITAFVHHNTLHAFESEDFSDAVLDGGQLYGCEPFWREPEYRQKLREGRIRLEDLDAVLQEDLGEEADRLVATFGTRYALRLAMLQHPLYCGTTEELRWVIAETEALRKFRSEVPPLVRQSIIATTRDAVNQWVEGQRSERFGVTNPAPIECLGPSFQKVLDSFQRSDPTTWTDRSWEHFTLNVLWNVCLRGVQSITRHEKTFQSQSQPSLRPRNDLIEQGFDDPDQRVNEVLIPFTAAFLDQGFSDWNLPHREAGFFQSFLRLHTQSVIGATSRFRRLRRAVRRVINYGHTANDVIEQSLQYFGIDNPQEDTFLLQTLLALRGWAGMIWQMESNASWTPRPAAPGSLLEFTAIRLLLDRLAYEEVFAEKSGRHDSPRDYFLQRRPSNPVEISRQEDEERRAFMVFQLAQVRGWTPRELQRLTFQQWALLIEEIEAFDSYQRRRIYHQAYERKYRNAALDALIAHTRNLNSKRESSFDEDKLSINDFEVQSPSTPQLQVVCCIDDREESLRRHLEEVEPDCETFGIAGFYGTAMYFRGAGQAHFKPLCPVSIRPDHYVIEEPSYSMWEVGRRRTVARRRLGQLSYQTHRSTRSIVGGVATAVVGSFAAFPLVGRVLFPRTASKLQSFVGRIVEPPPTKLRLERVEHGPDSYGFTIAEMTEIVFGALKASGLCRRFAPLVVILGHGSQSLNNPHESAYNCGACAGSQGGPNARAFAAMANDSRVRRRLAERDLVIPETTFFIGGYHDTTNDSVTFADLDQLPITHRERFEVAAERINEARQRNAHERCRRFLSAPTEMTFAEALRHVENRPEDLSQARPEYNHATNALCFVGRRAWSRDLFLDRRAFLTSYDPANDDNRGSILEGLLRAAIPVCAGINLEYYFSTVDTEGYGCGSKLPHNITSLLGVMVGPSSDLRPGLSEQMVEIHEPMRILFVVETTREAMTRIIAENDGIKRLVEGQWVQLAVFCPEESLIYRYVRGEFVLYAPHDRSIPAATSSLDCYVGKRGPIDFMSIRPVGADQRGVNRC